MSPAAPGPADLSHHEDVPGWAIRLEAKVDIALAHHGTRLDSIETAVADLRRDTKDVIEKKEVAHHAIEQRLLTLERQPTVTPRQLGATVLGVIGAVGALAPFLDRLYA